MRLSTAIVSVWMLSWAVSTAGWVMASANTDRWRALAISYKHDAEAAASDARRNKSNLDFCTSTIAQRCQPCR